MKLFVFIAVFSTTLFGAGAWSGTEFAWVVAAVEDALESKPVELYRTATVTTGRIRQTITATGSLRAVVTVEVSSQLSGQVAIHVP